MDIPTGAAYFDLIGQARKSYGRFLEPLCRERSLTRNELDVMLFLYNNPQFRRAADIVQRRGIAKSHVSAAVAALEERGLLQRQYDREDRRMLLLTLTPAGREITAQARSIQEAFFAGIFRGIAPEEMALWQDFIRRVAENIASLEK